MSFALAVCGWSLGVSDAENGRVLRGRRFRLLEGKKDKQNSTGPAQVRMVCVRRHPGPDTGAYICLRVNGCDVRSGIYTRMYICLSLCGVDVCRPVDEL